VTNLGRRRGDGVGYQRGTGSVEVELANLQSEVERIGPIIRDSADRIDNLESDRDSAKGMLKVIAVLQTIMILSFIALLGWGLNHVTFHSDWERPEHSGIQSPQDSQTHADYHPEVTK
jgi:hypothetical protein